MKRKKNPIDVTKIIKSIDPIFQSILLIAFFWLIDLKGTKYHYAILWLVRFQLVSSVVHIFLKFHRKLKYERFFSLIAIAGWLYLYKWTFENLDLQVHYVTLIEGKGFSKINMNDFTMMLLGLVVAFWYYSICLREIRAMVKKRKKG